MMTTAQRIDMTTGVRNRSRRETAARRRAARAAFSGS